MALKNWVILLAAFPLGFAVGYIFQGWNVVIIVGAAIVLIALLLRKRRA